MVWWVGARTFRLDVENTRASRVLARKRHRQLGSCYVARRVVFRDTLVGPLSRSGRNHTKPCSAYFTNERSPSRASFSHDNYRSSALSWTKGEGGLSWPRFVSRGFSLAQVTRDGSRFVKPVVTRSTTRVRFGFFRGARACWSRRH